MVVHSSFFIAATDLSPTRASKDEQDLEQIYSTSRALESKVLKHGSCLFKQDTHCSDLQGTFMLQLSLDYYLLLVSTFSHFRYSLLEL
ncbi:uncharacterized protein LOC131231000 isoform X2 [Magnolia sinica]|uniref:uncharacterized protein LOC131231000 isoform X2 n=1 Tax=Magnolia sinica TaxID=86752 RepID=UPI002657FF97|nr:uncharacterized protein LOC131231000 isoform X2 [Magnolia sinica]